ncbi:MAG: pirin family protein [Planctomycetaceae bacterium]
MLMLRPAVSRGRTQLDWLDSWHSFSFADYHDPAWHGFRVLRVINDDRIGPTGGFDTHPHRDMEIITYVMSGQLEHRDSLGNGSVIRPGDVQRMTAGRGILHSEFNPSPSEPVHLLQIWIFPERKGLDPGYEQKHFTESERSGRLKLVASRDGRDGSVSIAQDVDLFAAKLAPGETLRHSLRSERHAWLQVAQGAVVVNGTKLGQGDGAAISDTAAVEIASSARAEVLLFDLP